MYRTPDRTKCAMQHLLSAHLRGQQNSREEPVVQPVRRGRSVAAHPYNMSATEIKVRRWAIAAAAPVAAAVGLCGYLLCLFGNDKAPSPRLQAAATEQGVVSLAENLVSSMQKTCSMSHFRHQTHNFRIQVWSFSRPCPKRALPR